MKLQRKRGFYEQYIKRLCDIICSLLAIICFSWLYIILAIFVRMKLGSPVLFRQPRPGMIDKKTGKERIFDMYKFRTMSDERGADGELLSDEERLGKFGRMLRRSSLDELPEAFNILIGDMSIIGPRPQLVKDMVFMSDEIRKRHTAKPGLSGLAQVMGRNAIGWKKKFEWDLEYIEHISFWNDLKILGLTVMKVFGAKTVDTSEETNITWDYGDALLHEKKVTQEKYDALQAHARDLIDVHEKGRKRWKNIAF